MDIRITELNINNQSDFFSLFEVKQFAHQANWKTCFCRFYFTDGPFEEWMKRSGEDNRKEAEVEISRNNMNGLLAYDENLCVGWLNVGSVLRYKRLLKDILDEYKNDNTALSICFVIREEYRNKGIASALLDFAIDKFRKNGFKQMIALPRDVDIRERNYRGFSQMYLNRGYQEVLDAEGNQYLVLDL